MSREHTEEVVAGLIAFGIVTATKIASAASSVLLKVRGDAPDEVSAGDAVEEEDDAELWAHATLLYRPADSDATGTCETLGVRHGDEIVVCATKDRRWQVSLDKGDCVVRALGPSASSVRLTAAGEAVIDAAVVKIGGVAAGQHIGLGDAIAGHLSALQTYLDLHTHVCPAGASGPPAAPGPFPSPVTPVVASGAHLVEA